jgi:TPR repeat protein
MSAEVRIDDDFELAVADQGAKFRTLYVRVLGDETALTEGRSAQDCRDGALRGCLESQAAWGMKLLQGDSVPRDQEAAARWFNMAALRGHADALNMLGRCYEFGWGVTADGREAVRCYTRAADQGHAWGEFNLASLYATGRFVPHDPKRALTLLVRSARRGNPKAMNMLGRYREEQGPPRARDRSARLWYRWAAERGCFRGAFHLGRYLVAEGRTADGIRWFATSLSNAPQDFRDDAIAYLGAHPDAQLRALVAGVETRAPRSQE